MSDEDPSVPIVLYSQGITELPDGSWELVVDCPTIVHYVTLPETLQYGPRQMRKCGFNSDKRIAYYRTTYATVEEVMRVMM